VCILEEPGALRLRVENGPATALRTPDARHRAGHGLIGMQERVSLLGGTMSAWSRANGSFEVSAILPLDLVTTPGSIPDPFARQA
jgi:signal transduction histidine kinase